METKAQAYVDNIGCIGEFPNLEQAKDAARETIRNSARADKHAFVIIDGEIVWEAWE